MSAPVTDLMSEWALQHPDQLAVIAADRKRGAYRGFTYADFETRTKMLAGGFTALGLAGKRVVLMVTPGQGMFEAGYGLMRAGAVPVLIDPGLGLSSVSQSIRETEPEGFVGVPTALAARTLYRWAPDAVAVSAGKMRKGVDSLDDVARMGRFRGDSLPDSVDGPAAIVFTSGSTGPPKGVVMTHDVFSAQVAMISRMYGLQGGMKSLSTFAPFALLGPLMGLTTILPRMDFSKPGDVDPTRIIELAEAFEPDLMFGSPALLDRVGRYGEATGDRLGDLSLILSAGAPVRPDIRRRILNMAGPDAVVATPYGATEALPVASIDSRELDELSEVGICVGRPVEGVDVMLIPITDGPIADLRDIGDVPDGVFGEIVVRGQNVTAEYVERPNDTALAKVSWGGQIAHRMGDLGRFDDQGRLWFGGRRSHRLQTDAGDLPVVPIEALIDQHPAVARSAVVALADPGMHRMVACVELEDAYVADPGTISDIEGFARRHESAETVGADRLEAVLVHKGFPTDIRHNSKIDRLALGRWAASRLDVEHLPGVDASGKAPPQP